MIRIKDAVRARADVFCTMIAFLLPLAVYVRTMPPTIYGLDSAELTTGAYSLGIVHSPGAPTYMLIGNLFSKIPVGDVGFRLNLLSAFFGAATIAVVYRIIRGFQLSVSVAMIASGLLAFSFYFWVWAIVAELYAPHAFFASITLLCLLRWRASMHIHHLMVGALLFGLGCGNHTAMVLMVPGYCWLLFSSSPCLALRPRLTLAALLCGLVGLSVFAYFPVRQPASPEVDYVSTYFPKINLGSISGLLWMIRGGMFESLFFDRPLLELPTYGWRFTRMLVSNFTAFGVLLAAWGCCSLCKKRRTEGVALILLFITHTLFFLMYGARDRFWMLSVSYVIAAIWIAEGITASQRFLHRRSRTIAHGIPAVAAAACIPFLVAVNWPRLDLSHDTSARDIGVELASKMEKNAVLFGLWEQVPILEYLQIVEGLRKDIELHNAVFLAPSQIFKMLERSLAEGYPVYVSHPQLAPFSGVSCSVVVTNSLYQVSIEVCAEDVR